MKRYSSLKRREMNGRKAHPSLVWWHISLIPATQEVQLGGQRPSAAQQSHEILSKKETKTKNGVVEEHGSIGRAFDMRI
jgi:hypothetical protein